MIIRPIASGSSGNAYYVSDGRSGLLLDAGIPLKRIQEGCGYGVSGLAGCLVTHAHSDHVKAAGDLMRLGVDVFASRGTLDAAGLSGHRARAVAALEPFEAGSFTVLPFDVEHDAPEPLGFLMRSNVTGEKLLYFTDTYFLRYRFEGLTHIMMEANYDPGELERNVASGRIDAARAARTVASHMSIDTAIATLRTFDLSRLRQVWLLHLSSDNAIQDEFVRRVRELTGKDVRAC